MNHVPKQRTRRRRAAVTPVEVPEEVPRPRTHGDSYTEPSREEDLIGTSSSHARATDRRTEEPCDPPRELLEDGA